MKLKKIGNISLFYISLIFSYSYFWFALAIPYLSYRGLTSIESFSLMSLYQIVGVVIEYPTSILGDRYGYRRTLILGNILSALSMFFLAQQGTYWYYAFGLLLNAGGTSLLSGNEEGLLKEISSKVRSDTAIRSAVAEFVLFLSAIIGGWLGGIDYSLALYVSGGLMLLAALPIFIIRTNVTKHRDSLSIKIIFKDGVGSLKNPIFQQIYLILAVFGGFFFTIKSIFGSFGEIYHYPIEKIGIIIGLGALFRSLGSAIYAKYDSFVKTTILYAMCFITASVSFASSTLAITGLLIFNLFAGYILSAIDGDIQELAPDHIRSSLFSFKRLIMKLFSSIYLLFYGYMVDFQKFPLMMLIVGAAMFATVYITRNYARVNLNEK